MCIRDRLNDVFSRLTDLIRSNRGTIDKYMGDCVMAFWGAPVDTPNHAELSVKTAIEMTGAIRKLNEEHRAKDIPEIGIGIGLNTGPMRACDMGSDIRRRSTAPMSLSPRPWSLRAGCFRRSRKLRSPPWITSPARRPSSSSARATTSSR